MTKKPEIFKLMTVAVMATGLLAGCASDGSSETMETAPAKQETAKAGPNAAAKNAIYSAKIKNSRAKRLGYEWRDTGKMIAAAEKAAAKGDNDKAVELANAARDQASAAIEQASIEAERFEKLHGTTELGDSGSMSAMGNKESGNKSHMMGSGSSSMGDMNFEPASASNDYTVVSGDNLWNISAKDSVYGNPYQWPLIYKANSSKIKDADLIFPGQVFGIPSATSSEVSAAVHHAKTRGAWTLGESESSDADYLAQ